ncbi:MAG: Co2+/Mg2+ efflux protein ApaG [Methylococcales bacterium]|jgi:ApaG protein|nr:Co2+/Mg2+ efflux protein ApaG [Methylococcales bacterium]MBT7444055.1 Co2+/Mg2+ efflux protein ApaG [Methylococcales bacterium]
MNSTNSYNIKVSVQVEYIEKQSQPEHNRYLFAYTITIKNEGQTPAKLLTRKWLIQDSNGKNEEVFGEGVVGEQPHLEPNQSYQYTSSAMIETPVGSMQGSYQMMAGDGHQFDASVAPFSLSVPRVLH